MKKNILFGFLILNFTFLIFNSVQAQVLCIMCFDQNDSISTGVNNLLLNGGFENTNCVASTGVIGSPTSFCPNSTGYSCDLMNWTCTGGGTSTYCCIYDQVTNKSMIEEGNNAVYFGNFYANPCSATSGDTSCLITSGCTVSGPPVGFPWNPDPAFGSAVGVSLEQTVNGLTIGATYVLEFWAGGEEYMTDPGLFALNVGFGDTMLRDRNTPIGAIGTRYLIMFNAVSTSHTIKFTNWGHICGNCTELVLDDVRLYTVAELSPTIQPCAGITTVALFSAPHHICPGTCTDFTNLSLNGITYLWDFPGASPSTSTDINPSTICYNTPGSYDVTLIANGASSSDTLTLHNYITVYPYPAPQGIMQSGDTLFANAGAVSYQWYHTGNIIPGATDYFYVAQGSGDFNVVATDANGCEVEAAIFDVVASSGFEVSGFRFQVYPNPVEKELKIKNGELKIGTVIKISIYNMLGVLAAQPQTSSIKPETSVDVRALSKGMYWLEINTGGKIYRSKFVKE